MSIQLIIYPQTYQGHHNVVSLSATEKCVNGINFTGLSTALSHDCTTGNVPLEIMTSAYPTIPNTWYRYRSTTSGTPSLPINSAGTAIMYATTIVTISGIYQRLTNLTVGASYTISVAISNYATGSMLITTMNNDGTQNSNYINSASGFSVLTTTFIASEPDNTLMVSYYATVVDDVAISGVSVQPTGEVPGYWSSETIDGQQILDLYEDEDIPLTLSVDDFKNSAEQVQSYSKAFNIPATKRNNKIFDNIFEITRADNGLVFNPYVKTKSVLKQDGFILFEGYLRLIDIQDKEGEISYNINLYSEVVALADILKDKTFNNMSFEELEHDYDITSISRSWNESGLVMPYLYSDTSGFRSDYDTVKYPFVDWNHQMVVSDGSLGTAGNPQLTKLEQAFRPFIQIRYLIQRIFSETNLFSYTSSFIDSDDFKRLYMDFNWGSSEDGPAPNTFNTLYQDDDQSSDYFINETSYNAASKLRFNTTGYGDNTYWDNTNYKYTSTVNNWEVECEFNIYLRSVATISTYSNEVRIAKFNSLGQVLEVFAEDNNTIGAGNTKTFAGDFTTVLQSGEYIQAQSTTQTANKIKQSTIGFNCNIKFESSNQWADVFSMLNQARSDIGQWNFLKGLMTMFNLVSIPDPSNPNNILIEPYRDIFMSSGDALNPNYFDNNSTELNWTPKVDVSEMKLTPLTELNKKTIFKFVEDDDDHAFNTYKEAVFGHLYGSKVYDASAYTILEGTKEIVAEPFAATVIKPLMPQYNDIITPAVYAMNEDGTSSGFDNSSRIMYNNGVKTTVSGYYIPAQNGGAAVASETEYLQFSHLTDVPTITTIPPAATDTNDFHFGACQFVDAIIGNPTANNLFNLYWLPYFNELYNPDTRTMTMKVNLTSGDVNKFSFYDVVIIKNRKFRVNKINYKPNDLATVEFILIT
tara:strand:+ start:2224 stop:4992 length:2769 start_codon:yes stop_codon:yes gene_type:complete